MFLNQPVTKPIFEPFTAIVKPAEQPKPEPVLYTIVEGDVLEKVAIANASTVQRIYDKNTDIVDPDLIEVGQKLVIPFPEEELPSRLLPATEPVKTVVNVSQTTKPRPTINSSGNTYAKGYCTEFAKAMRPDLPNRMGDAIRWPSSARAAGFSTGSTPRAGAIGQLGNHVVYVTSVNANGTFNVTEQNYKGLFIVSSRSNVSPSGWQFIY